MKVSVNGETLAENGRVAKTFLTRLMGLMFTSEMRGYDALLFSPGNSIHTCFMRYSIDVLFIDKNNKIVRVIRRMKPWRFTKLYWNSIKVIEFYGGTLSDNIRKGDTVCIN